MNKTSLKYLQAQTDLENVIDKLAPEIVDQAGQTVIDSLNKSNKALLPAWMFVEAVEQAPVAISITDRKGYILYANQAFCEVSGYSIDELSGKNQSMLSYKATPNHIYEDLWKTITRNLTWHGQLINRHKNDAAYLADLTVAPMQDSLKNITHYLGMHRDITEAYQADKKLQNQKTLIESVINASPIAMAVLNSKNEVILDNLQYKSLISDLDKEEPAILFLKLLSMQLGNLSDYMKKHPNGFSNIEIRVENSQKNKPLWFSCSGRVFHEKPIDTDSFFEESSEPFLLLSFSNITRQRAQQEEAFIRSMKVMLAKEEQVRSIRETLLGTIHQVNQPLNQIQAARQLMESKKEKGPLLKLMMELEQNCQQTLTTLQSCVPQIPPSSVSPINLNRILHEVLLLNSDKFLKNGVIIDWKPETVLPNIIGAENKLRMLFKQLIDNAIDALNKSSRLERTISIKTALKNRRVVIKLTDSGDGIPVDEQSKVFQPFYTTQHSGGIQAGMGLVMAKEIVQQTNGTIEIDPDYTDGCRFVLSFPVISTKKHNEL